MGIMFLFIGVAISLIAGAIFIRRRIEKNNDPKEDTNQSKENTNSRKMMDTCNTEKQESEDQLNICQDDVTITSQKLNSCQNEKNDDDELRVVLTTYHRGQK